MGQYHKLYNLDKKEVVCGHGIGCGVKLLEQVGFPKSTSTALFLLVSNSNGRGGGDAEGHPLIGSWAGDRIVLQGDYAEEGDRALIPDADLRAFRDISLHVSDMLDVALRRF